METKWKQVLGAVLMTLGLLLFIGGCIAAGIHGDYHWIIYGVLIGINISLIGFMCYHSNRLKDVPKPGGGMTSTIIMVTLFGLCLLYCLFVRDFYICGFNMRVFSISILAIQLFHGIVLVLEERKHRKNHHSKIISHTIQ